MTKREARALAKARRAELDMQAVGCGMARALFALPCWAAADTVLAFAAMPDEPDTAAILRQALADGKRLLLPRVRSRTEMDWVEIPSLSLLQPGAYGIPEPPADRPAADPGGYAATLALIPCLAAGTDGVRLGIMTVFWHNIRGKGCCSARRRPCWRTYLPMTGMPALPLTKF